MWLLIPNGHRPREQRKCWTRSTGTMDSDRRCTHSRAHIQRFRFMRCSARLRDSGPMARRTPILNLQSFSTKGAGIGSANQLRGNALEGLLGARLQCGSRALRNSGNALSRAPPARPAPPRRRSPFRWAYCPCCAKCAAYSRMSWMVHRAESRRRPKGGAMWEVVRCGHCQLAHGYGRPVTRLRRHFRCGCNKNTGNTWKKIPWRRAISRGAHWRCCTKRTVSARSIPHGLGIHPSTLPRAGPGPASWGPGR
jgi:hypothetical protein